MTTVPFCKYCTRTDNHYHCENCNKICNMYATGHFNPNTLKFDCEKKINLSYNEGRGLSEKTVQMKRFVLNRIDDSSGISGTGIVAEGVQFSTGWCALTWLSQWTSVVFYTSIQHVQQIHGHEGRTVIEWIDE